MRTAPILTATGVVALVSLLDCAPGPHAQGRLAQPRPLPTSQDSAVTVICSDPGAGRIGTNVFRATVTNNRTTPTPFGFSLRAESPSRAVQKSHYRLLQPGEAIDLDYEYELPNRGYRLLIAYYGIVHSMPTEQERHPEFVSYRLQRFALRPGGDQLSHERQQSISEPTPVLLERAAARDNARRQLSETLNWGRPASPSFRAQVRDPERVGGYRLQVVQIATEPDKTIDLLFIRQVTASGRLPTILYLSGNPPGRKESGIVPGMILADLGLQVVAIDRRESARHTARGEYLSAVADPVFDARRAVDYLLTREDVDTARIGVFGFSKGSEEGMYLTVLHPSIRAAVLASRLVEQDSLFNSNAWLPTIYSEDVLHDLGLDSLIGNWSELTAAITPAVSARALTAYRSRYPYFDSLDPAVVLPLAAPKPVLVVTGARDRQIMLPGALALDDRVQAVYREMGMSEHADFLIMPRSDHGMPGDVVEHIGQWLDEWLHAVSTRH